jgi:hypothetical protein
VRLFSAENAHWYRRDGEPLHCVPAVNGEPRPTTLRDARKLGLLPSVTNVLGVINKPELVEWKMTQAVLAALTLPRRDGEDLGVFAKRVVEDAQSQVKGAAEFGSAFHAGAEHVAKTLEVDPAGPCAAWLNRHRDWFQANCIRTVWTERVLVSVELGYAGTADLLVEHQQHGLTLVDYKTQGGAGARPPRAGGRNTAGNGRVGDASLPGWEPRVYKSWCQQLAAYRRAVGKPMACMSVIVNSTEPSAPVEHLWSEEELRAGLESFEAALVIWRNEKGYDPRSLRSAAMASATMQPTTAPGGGPQGRKEFGAPVLVA